MFAKLKDNHEKWFGGSEGKSIRQTRLGWRARCISDAVTLRQSQSFTRPTLFVCDAATTLGASGMQNRMSQDKALTESEEREEEGKKLFSQTKEKRRNQRTEKLTDG